MRALCAPPAPDLSLGIPEEMLLPATEPAEERGSGRDDVRLLVQDRDSGIHIHGRFPQLGRFLQAGDLLVLNRSGTLPASLPARLPDGSALRLHVAGRIAQGIYRVEARSADGLAPLDRVPPRGTQFLLTLPDGESLSLDVQSRADAASRQVVVRTAARRSLQPWMRRIGDPIRYAYVPRPWPLSAYQTAFAGPAGSSEMPSAGRPFTLSMLHALRRSGIGIAYLTLHCGLSSEEVRGSLDQHFLPAEPYHLPGETVRAIMRTRRAGGRVVAVGTTVVRALQSACADGDPRSGRGSATAVVRPGVRPCAVDGLLTGMHTPRSSHLALLEAFLPAPALRAAYLDAIAHGYLWHEFGDLHLILPAPRRRA